MTSETRNLALDVEGAIDTIADYATVLMTVFSKERDSDFPNFDRAIHRLAMEIHSQARFIEQRVAEPERAA